MNCNFNSSSTVAEGECYAVKGLNIWDYKWKATGEYIQIKDTVRQQQLTMRVYEIRNNDITLQFAAQEVSNGVFIIYHAYEG